MQRAAAAYMGRGWHPIPLRYREKRPRDKGWPTIPYRPENFGAVDNLGLALGEPGGGLVDVDIDMHSAAALADHVFGGAPAFGRASAPRTHRLFRCPDPGNRATFQLKGDEVAALGLDEGEKAMIVELRGTGHQTMVPPSLHPSGEVVEWMPWAADALPECSWGDLRRRCGLFAFLAVISRAYPPGPGNRDDVCMALAGALLAAGCEVSEADDLIQCVATLASDEEASDRCKASQTRAKMDADEPVCGLPRLCELLGIESLETKLRRWLGIRGAAGLPAILMQDGKLPQVVDKAEAALMAGGCQIYQRGEMLARVARLDSTEESDGVRRGAGAIILTETRAHWLTEQMARTAYWMKMTLLGPVPADPKPKYARTYLDRVGEWRVPPLRGVVQAPTLRADGSILQAPGYDAESQLLLEPGGVEFPEVADEPSRDEAETALALIEELFAEFPFVTEADRAVVLAATLTGLVRRSLRSAPLFAMDAPTAGTGKSLIAETIGTIITGSVPAHMSQGKSAEEDEKRLSTVLMAGDPLIVLDNCDRVIEGDFLCSMLTQEMVQARILGKSERVLLPSCALVMATGNNLILAGDVTRRALLCRLDARVERPDRRQFDFDPRERARARRPELVVAGLTVLRAYIVAGRPRPMDKIGSFEDWNLVREALCWLDRADPAETRERVLDDDPRKSELHELLAAWHDALGDQEMTLAQVRQACTSEPREPEHERLFHALVELSGGHDINAKKIGWRLRRWADRVVAGLVLERRKEDREGAVWSVRLVDGGYDEDADGDLPF